MKVSELISFRRDLLFQGAVQINWFETDRKQSEKAAENFVFHGPDYHGVIKSDSESSETYARVDTANFVHGVLQKICINTPGDPFTLAIAGYGTGKSHLGLTIAEMLDNPEGKISKKIIENIKKVDLRIGERTEESINITNKPFLVIAINGMQDFDLSKEITRQVFVRLKERELNTGPLDDLKPRFKIAQSFITSFFTQLEDEFKKSMGKNCTKEFISENLAKQDEETYMQVSKIYEQKMGTDIRSTGQESLQDFMKVACRTYCGTDKPFRGMLIIFDEFGRYLEFAVQKPYIAGSGTLQQLFEGVQDNSDDVFLLSFIQYELKAYMSRVAPELRDNLNRYVSRYDSVPKVHLSTNLETIIASLLEKKDITSLKKYLDKTFSEEDRDILVERLHKWFPAIKHHGLWINPEMFSKIIIEGCWPLHPSATWFIYQLSSAGKALQQRSAISLLAQALEKYENKEIPDDFWTIPAAALCTEDMVSEFLASESYGQQGALAHAFISIRQKYSHELTTRDVDALKAILLASKIGICVESSKECNGALAMLAGRTITDIERSIRRLASEYNVVEWNETTHQYELVGDALPRKAFDNFIQAKIGQVTLDQRAQLFATQIKQWLGLESCETDFGIKNKITTTEWKYAITCSNVSLLEGHLEYAFRTWLDARDVDDYRGHLIYCYVGQDSDFKKVEEKIPSMLKNAYKKVGIDEMADAPVAIVLLNDEAGTLGDRIAENWVLNYGLQQEEMNKFTNFLMERKSSATQELHDAFKTLEIKKDIYLACHQKVIGDRLRDKLTNLFSIVYKSCIPFLFDGFHTARGNAAKDCQLFTTELFAGNLNQNWIATRKSQQKNRAVSVLHDSWQVLGSDGYIKMRPGNKALLKIIDALDSRIKAENIINLGVIGRELCAPPIGCNLASMGMLLGVFIAPRREKLWFTREDEVVSIESWLSEAFQNNTLSLSVLDETYVKLANIEEIDEWSELLNNWDSEITFQGQMDFLTKAYELKRRVSLPPAYKPRFALLEQRSSEAIQELQGWDKVIDEQSMFLERAYTKKDAGNLSRCGAELVKLYKKMESNSDAWTKEQFEKLEPFIQKSKTATQQYFKEWLQSEVILDPRAWGNFEHTMKRISNNLKALELSDEQKQLEGHVDKVRSDMEQHEKIKLVVDRSKIFLQTHTISHSTRVKELNDTMSEIKALLDTIEKARDIKNVPQLDKEERNLREFRQKCQEQLNTHHERAQQIWNAKLLTISDIEQNMQEILALMTVYDGLENDLNDFRVIRNFMRSVMDHYQKLTSQDLNDQDLQSLYSSYLEEAESIFGEEELPWNINEIYENILSILKEQRSKIATQWLETTIPEDSTILKLSAIDANQLRSKLLNPPAILEATGLRKVEKALKLCEKQLDGLEVDGLLARFQNLSKEAKIKFIEEANKLLQT